MSRRRRVTVYVEGGGNDNDLLRTQCRQGFKRFTEAAGITGVGFVSRGGRNQAHDAFCTALSQLAQGDVVLLLVDSEDPVKEKASLWAHLESRENNCLSKPNGADEEHLFLMVQCMESWFLADVDALKKRFGTGFNPKALQAWQSPESVPKAAVLDALEKATRACHVPYAKGQISFEVLALASPFKVGEKCPNAARFLDRLRKHTSDGE